jgi:hypothetical protein
MNESRDVVVKSLQSRTDLVCGEIVTASGEICKLFELNTEIERNYKKRTCRYFVYHNRDLPA